MKKMALISFLSCAILSGCGKEERSSTVTIDQAGVGQVTTMPTPAVVISPHLSAHHLATESPNPNGVTANFSGQSELRLVGVGSVVWIQPWSMWHNNGDYYVNGFHSYSTSFQKNWVKATRQKDGWEIDVTGVDFEWVQYHFPVTVPVTVADIQSMPVVSIKE